MTQILLSPQAQQQISAAGGAADVNIALVNLYDEEYPNYGVPLVNLTVSSKGAATVRPTFAITVRLLHRLLTARQAKLSVRPRNRISAQVIGDTGLTVQGGSPKRVLAGLAVLALIAYSALFRLLGRRRPGRRFSRHGHRLNWPRYDELSRHAIRLNPVPAMRRPSR